jgi:hypothetical protein
VCGVESSGLRKGPMAEASEHGNEPFGSGERLLASQDGLYY